MYLGHWSTRTLSRCSAVCSVLIMSKGISDKGLLAAKEVMRGTKNLINVPSAQNSFHHLIIKDNMRIMHMLKKSHTFVTILGAPTVSEGIDLHDEIITTRTTTIRNLGFIFTK